MGQFRSPGAEQYFLRKKIWTVPLILQFNICEGDIGDKADDDFGYLFQKPSDAVSGSVPKGHVGHLNDLVPVGRGKPVRVKSIYEKGAGWHNLRLVLLSKFS